MTKKGSTFTQQWSSTKKKKKKKPNTEWVTLERRKRCLFWRVSRAIRLEKEPSTELDFICRPHSKTLWHRCQPKQRHPPRKGHMDTELRKSLDPLLEDKDNSPQIFYISMVLVLWAKTFTGGTSKSYYPGMYLFQDRDSFLSRDGPS